MVYEMQYAEYRYQKEKLSRSVEIFLAQIICWYIEIGLKYNIVSILKMKFLRTHKNRIIAKIISVRPRLAEQIPPWIGKINFNLICINQKNPHIKYSTRAIRCKYSAWKPIHFSYVSAYTNGNHSTRILIKIVPNQILINSQKNSPSSSKDQNWNKLECGLL